MVVSLKTQGAKLAIAQRLSIPTEAPQIYMLGNQRCRWGTLLSRASLLAGLLAVLTGVSTPARANAEAVISESAVVSPTSLLTALQKPDSADKTTAQFEQTHFERIRQQATQSETAQAEQARIERLRLLQAQARQSRGEWLQQEVALPATLPSSAAPLTADGVYLYGQQPIRDQLETAYFVFEALAGNVTGAFYMPSSSFDCAQGRISNEQIELAITNSDSQETYRYALALDTSAADVASQQGAVAAPLDISGFHPLPVSEGDRAILATCQAL
ncbi:MAG: hypothetical protein ACR2FS_11385 [Phormidesmis sp.]